MMTAVNSPGRAKMKDRNDFDVGCPLCWAFEEEHFDRPAADDQGGDDQ